MKKRRQVPDKKKRTPQFKTTRTGFLRDGKPVEVVKRRAPVVGVSTTARLP